MSARAETREALTNLKALPVVRDSLQGMPEYFEQGWHDSKVLIAHELDNLTNENIFTK